VCENISGNPRTSSKKSEMSTRSGFMFFPARKVSTRAEFIDAASGILGRSKSVSSEDRVLLFEFINLLRSNKAIVEAWLPDYFINDVIFKMLQLNEVMPSRTLSSIIKDFYKMLSYRRRHPCP
jgi:hypothetical protein